MSVILSTARAAFITAVGGGTVYGSIKAGVWSTDGSKSVETLREVKLPPSLFLQRDNPYTQQKALKGDDVSIGGWPSRVLEAVKAGWNRTAVTVTSALVNEHQQWNKMASWTSAQMKKVNDYFRPPPTG